MVATPSAQPRLWRRSHHPEGYGDGGAALCSRPNGQAQHHTWGRRRGCRHAFQPAMEAETSSRRREEEQGPQQAKLK
jgi:hypothetical protein